MTLKISAHYSSSELRGMARQETNGRAVARMYAIAHALDGLSRAVSARLAGMERQALRDAVVRYNAEGVAGLYDRPKGRPPFKLTPEQKEKLRQVVLAGPDPEKDNCCTWTRESLCAWVKREFKKSYHPSSMGRLLRSLGLSRQKARPCHPKSDEEARESFKKGGFATA